MSFRIRSGSDYQTVLRDDKNIPDVMDDKTRKAARKLWLALAAGLPKKDAVQVLGTALRISETDSTQAIVQALKSL